MRDEFLRAIHAVEPTRRRNGATSWRVFRDVAEDGHYVERYIINSWAEYVRLRTRMTMADRKLQDRVAGIAAHGRAHSRVAADRRHRAGTVAVLSVMPFAVAPGARAV